VPASPRGSIKNALFSESGVANFATYFNLVLEIQSPLAVEVVAAIAENYQVILEK
jgi:hypothetical protein